MRMTVRTIFHTYYCPHTFFTCKCDVSTLKKSSVIRAFLWDVFAIFDYWVSIGISLDKC